MTTLFSKPTIPPPAPTASVPAPDSPEVLAARRRAIADMQNRAGRQSTILSSGGGSDTYGDKSLGTASA